MAVTLGGLIEVADYNALALEINRLYSDNTSSLVFSTSDIILSDTAAPGGEAGGATRTLSPIPTSGDHLVVVVDGLTWSPAQYSVNYISGQITFIDALAASVTIVVYNRNAHRYGWGQQASVYPITAGDPILADEATLQAYLEANVNNLIDKLNVIEERIDGPTALTRVAPGNLVRATDKSTITDAINNDVLVGDNYWQNVIATVTSGVATFERVADWDNQLIGVMRHTWTDYDTFRHFFNAGNDIRGSVTMTGDPLNQGYNNWNQVTSQMGSLLFGTVSASQTGTGGISEGLGAYDLTSNFQTIFSSSSPSTPVTPGGDYDAYANFVDLIMLWEARIVENAPAAGNISIDIRLTMNDQALNSEITAGTTTYSGGYKLGDDVANSTATFSTTATAPTLTVLEDFNTGDDS